MKIFNNLADPIYIKIYKLNDIDDAEADELFVKGDIINSLNYDDFKVSNDDAVYITSYDTKKKIYRGDHIFVKYLEEDNPDQLKLEVCESVYDEFVRIDIDKGEQFDPDYIWGMSYVIPARVYNYFNICSFVALISIIIIAGIVLYVLLI